MNELEPQLVAAFDLDATFDPLRGKRVALLRERYYRWIEWAAAKPSPEAEVAVEALDLAITLMDGRDKLYHSAPRLVALGWLDGPTPPPAPPAPPAADLAQRRELRGALWVWRRGEYKHDLVTPSGVVLATCTSQYGQGWLVTRHQGGFVHTIGQVAAVSEAKRLAVDTLDRIYAGLPA